MPSASLFNSYSRFLIANYWEEDIPVNANNVDWILRFTGKFDADNWLNIQTDLNLTINKMEHETQRLLDADHLNTDYQTALPRSMGATKNILKLLVGEEECKIYAFRETKARLIIFYLLSIFTLGIYRLLAHWNKKLLVYVRYVSCGHKEATVILIIDNHKTETLKNVKNEFCIDGASIPNNNGTVSKPQFLRSFTYRKIKYIWYEGEELWRNPADIDSNAPFKNFLSRVDDEYGLDGGEIPAKRVVYGYNTLAVKLTPLLKVLLVEVLSPFYIFQVLSVTLWYSDNYEYYASVIVVITTFSAAIAVYQTRVQEKKVHEMVGKPQKVSILREGQFLIVQSDEIVPGDLISLPAHSFILPCDALLMNGSVIVNEAMLTGESVPVTKVPLSGADDVGDDVRFSSEKHNRHTLFCGTTLLQTRYYGGKPVLALAIRTGFSTLKGQLVRSIMYPKPMDSQYMKDLFKFILLLTAIASLGFIYTITIMIIRGEPFKHILVRSLDIITIVVPPALPAAMSVGIINANIRLRKKDIYCISPSTINTCGQVNVVCFDKTGTLTEDGLNFHTLRGVKNVEGHPEFSKEFNEIEPKEMFEEGVDMNIINAAATCQSLTRIDGTLHGDPLDLILFLKSGWSMDEPVDKKNETELFDSVQPTVLKPPSTQSQYHFPNAEYSTIRQFTFSSALQRMSVIVSTPADGTAHKMHIYTKGSPEKILELCDPETVPKNYMETIDDYAQRGFRLISVASKNIEMNFAKAMKAPRDKIECDLQFLGLVVMENRLKTVTLSVINELFTSNIRSVMVTGDNLLTAMSVARESGIIRPTKKAFLITHDSNQKDYCGRTKLFMNESVSSSESDIDTDSVVREFDKKLHLQPSKYHLAIAGPTYSIISREYPELLDQLAAVCDVYARMAPDQKSGLIVSLQQIGYKVTMCGDGANDCAALKAADAGISLSDAEASIAAPFTSKTPDIRCVLEVIKEGRCALVTSFAVFKYMAAYSLNEFLTVMLLYWISTNITDGQFLYIDFILITVVAMFLGNTGPANKLSLIPPPSRLATLCSVCSVIGQLLINFGAQLIAVFITISQPWYTKYIEDEDHLNSYEGTALFAVSSFMYLAFAFVYSKGAPYRRPVFTNYALCGVTLIIGAVTLALVLWNETFINDLMGFQSIPSFGFRLLLIFISFAASGVSVLFEYFFVQGVVATYLERKLRTRKLRKQDPSLPLFERILSEIGEKPDWFELSLRQATVSKSNETNL
ncbi:unnamed protein product [Caenorhabditis bovis]|uniref:Cation-transporting ATPase n=1 Tax=Caenorhabditis bovis TaxID=2654633 RepID=A0A8S1EKG7_9PELO|nr:unnamed protein product [Caenorhabditis bovis]